MLVICVAISLTALSAVPRRFVKPAIPLAIAAERLVCKALPAWVKPGVSVPVTLWLIAAMSCEKPCVLARTSINRLCDADDDEPELEV